MLTDMMEYGATVLKRKDVMKGVPEMMKIIQVEALFPDGDKASHRHEPNPQLVDRPGDDKMAADKTWSPPPLPKSVVPREAFDVGEPEKCGTIDFAKGDIEINAGRPTRK